MVAITHRGITYTVSSANSLRVEMDLGLQGGVDQDETGWLGSAYPGALTSFEPRQTDGTNRFNPRLVVLHVNGFANDATLTVSGQCSEIMHASAQGLGAAVATNINLAQSAAVGDALVAGAQSDATLTIDDGSGGASTAVANISVGDTVLDAEGGFIGVLDAVTATLLTLKAAPGYTVGDNTVIHKRTPLILKHETGSTESMMLLLLLA
jgi:hypothetical protein